MSRLKLVAKFDIRWKSYTNWLCDERVSTYQRNNSLMTKKIKAAISWGKIDKNFIQIQTLEKFQDTLLPKLISIGVRVAA